MFRAFSISLRYQVTTPRSTSHWGNIRSRSNGRDKHKIAFRNGDGRLWENKRASFGLKAISSLFMDFAVRALGPLKGHGAEYWMKDILLHSAIFEEHLIPIDQVLQGFRDFGLSVNLAKSVLCASTTSMVDAIAQLVKPTSVAQLRNFLGMTESLRYFVPNHSPIAAQLPDLLRNTRFAKKSCTLPLRWGQEQHRAFDRLKEALMSRPVLARPDLVLHPSHLRE